MQKVPIEPTLQQHGLLHKSAQIRLKTSYKNNDKWSLRLALKLKSRYFI